MIHLLLVLLGTLAFADQNSEHLARTARLRQKQLQLDMALKGFGLNPSSDLEAKAPTLSGEAPPPLLRVHSNFQDSKIAVGKLLFGKVINRLVVGGDGSPVLVQLDPGQGWISGLRILGVARQAGTPGRVSVELKQLLFRDTRSLNITAVGLDAAGAFGLEAQVFSQKAWAIGGAIASSFISGVAAAGQTQSQSAFGFSQPQVTGRNALLQGVAQTAADQSKRLVDESTQEKPVLVIEPDTAVTVLNQEEVHL